MNCKVFFINDKSSLNHRYRMDFMKKVYCSGYEVKSIGWLDSVVGFFCLLLKLAFFGKGLIIVSSNLKSNILTLLFSRRSTNLIILNGLGRLRGNSFFRALFVWLLKSNNESILLIQNYADFRYIKYLYFISSITQDNLHWIPGSGGSTRSTSLDVNKIVMVQRDSKIRKILPSLNHFTSANSNLLYKYNEIVVVGLKATQLQNVMNGFNVKNVGFVEQSDILVEGNLFFQPSGYGEGIPHTLVDAMCSGMCSIMRKKDYLRFGFYKMGFKYTGLKEGWICIERHLELSHLHLSLERINDQQIRLFFSCNR